MPRRVCTFAVAHTDISAQPFNNAARTVRIFAPNNLSGSAVYVKFSNYYSDGPVWVGNATIGLADAKGPPCARYRAPAHRARRHQLCAGAPAGRFFRQGRAARAAGLHHRRQPLLSRRRKGHLRQFCGHLCQPLRQGRPLRRPRAAQGPPLDRPFKSVLPWDISSATTTLSEVIVEQDDALPAPPRRGHVRGFHHAAGRVGNALHGAPVRAFPRRGERVQPRHRRQPPALRRNPRLPGHVRPRGHRALPLRPASHRGPHPRGVRSRHQRSGGIPAPAARRRRSLLPWTSTPPPPAPSRTRCTSRA